MADRIYTLVASSNAGRFALDRPDGQDITSGQPMTILLGGQWITGRVEHGSHGYRFVAGLTHCGLCVGMKVRV